MKDLQRNTEVESRVWDNRAESSSNIMHTDIMSDICLDTNNFIYSYYYIINIIMYYANILYVRTYYIIKHSY